MKILTARLLLLPFAWAFDAVTRLRNALFDTGVMRRRSFPLPVIAVGNLSVGGTGKTPHTEYLLRLLSGDRRVAMVSRGYGRSTRGFRLASPGDTAGDIGDEPWQMWHKFPQTLVAVDGDRCEALDRLLADGRALPDVAVLDDAFQHRHVRAGLYVLLTEYGRLYTDDWLMPVAARLVASPDKWLAMLAGSWTIKEVNGEALPTGMEKQPFLSFDVEKKTVHGNAGCNLVNGGFETEEGDATSIAFSRLATTMMACPDMEWEGKILKALNAVKSFGGLSIGEVGLYDAEGTLLLLLVRSDAVPPAGE